MRRIHQFSHPANNKEYWIGQKLKDYDTDIIFTVNTMFLGKRTLTLICTEGKIVVDRHGHTEFYSF